MTLRISRSGSGGLPPDRSSPVGASLLAMAAGQSASPVTDTPFSRAGSLPQGAVASSNSTGVSHGEETQGSHVHQGPALVQGRGDLSSSRQILFRLQ
ncbi:hypothetical protein DKY63_02440 [Pseudomonas putida]|uniref:Uncharacterized protein n=1 Tax=Pseudomonas putida TaxID=303 RepID=A0A2Z4RDD3_PSEPU|nr:hypothetical protein DKY63_02440 [Pseudomonas putida]